jgi:hypothetical protein
MDWLEEFVPFLRQLDGGNGSLEIALVITVTAVIGAFAYRHWGKRIGRSLSH